MIWYTSLKQTGRGACNAKQRSDSADPASGDGQAELVTGGKDLFDELLVQGTRLLLVVCEF